MERVVEAAKHEASPTAGNRAHVASPSAASLPPALAFQQLVGNQAMQQLVRSGYIHPKLAISNPDDPEELEADNLADKVMRKSAAAPCSCAEGEEMCDACRQQQSLPNISRRASASPAPSQIPPTVSDILRSPGHPLDSAARAFFEPRFGRDFSAVRLHTDQAAGESARSINAHAYTSENHIVFSHDQYSHLSVEGKSLLAHELAHVAQQGHAPSFSVREVGKVSNTHGGIFRQEDGGADAGTLPPSNDLDAGAGADLPGGEGYSRQAACVARLGGCIQVKSGGVVEASDIAEYNRDCKEREHTGYTGKDIWPNSDECRQYVTGELVDPDKLARLQNLTFTYLARLTAGELTLADAETIDAALRSAYSALQRAGISVALPAPVQPPPDMASDGSAVVMAGALPLTPLPEQVAGPTLRVIQGGLSTSGGAAAAGGETALTAGGTTVVTGETAGTATAVAAGTSAAAVVGAVLIGVAVLVVVGVTIYFIFYLDDPKVDPTIPKQLDDANNTIENTLASARRPRPRPVMPTGLSATDQELWKRCAALHDKYKDTQDDMAALGEKIAKVLDDLNNNRPVTDQQKIDLCDWLDHQIKDAEGLHKDRNKYVNDGCDKFDWFNQGTTEAQRRKDHQDALKDLDRQIKNIRAARSKFCPPFRK